MSKQERERERHRQTDRQKDRKIQMPHLTGFVRVQHLSLDNKPEPFPLLVFSHPQVAAHVRTFIICVHLPREIT